MATRSESLLLLCTSMSIWMLAAASADEEAALIAFKAAAIGGVGYGDPLASWNTSSIAGGYCSWEGVRCSGRGRNRQVVELSLPSRGLTGFLSPAIEDMSARVADFGLSRILRETANKVLQNSNSTIGIRGSIGYVAPEYGEGVSISTSGDVYSLGILLLETFTGRSPTDDMFKGSMDLHKFSEDALPDRIWEVADTTMWLHTYANDTSMRSRIENCLVCVIALGISCSKKQPRERTTIQDAATKMRFIRDSYEKEIEVGHTEEQQPCNGL